MLARICAGLGALCSIVGLTLPVLPAWMWTYFERHPKALLPVAMPFGVLLIYSQMAFQTGEPKRPVFDPTVRRVRLARVVIGLSILAVVAVAIYAWSVGDVERRQSSALSFAMVGSLMTFASLMIVAHWTLGHSPLWPDWMLRFTAVSGWPGQSSRAKSKGPKST